MQTVDPTLLLGEASMPPTVELSVEDVVRAAGNGGVQAPEAPPQPATRVPVGRIVSEESALEAATQAALQPLQPFQPMYPIPILLRRQVCGRYRSTGSVQLELRVDPDGRRPTRRISGDFYMQSGATLNYFGSFIVHSPTISVTTTEVVMDGFGAFTWAAGYPRVRVRIPRSFIFDPAPSATLQFLSATGSPGAIYTCPFASPYFRTVQLEEDRVAGLTPFSSYDTSSLPAPPPNRTLTVPAAYAEAGIEVQIAGIHNLVSTAGIGSSWSDAELHNAMMMHFSLWQNVPQWKVWLLTAQLHDLGPGLLGIMFDLQGAQRQGCAVFHASLGGTTATKLRDQLYTCVHELGHCFNLYHSFHKQYMNPPQPNRLDALSWMNYPWKFPGGAAAYWSSFPFQFDDQELVHLRHAFRNDIAMGGNPFGTGAALEAANRFDTPVEDGSGLRLELRARSTFSLGEPVVVELKLELLDMRGKEVNANLHPDFGFVEIGIMHPSGRVTSYEPPMEHLVIPAMTTLDRKNPSIYESAYIGYGRGGLYFDSPGVYQVRAVYDAPDGSRVVSNILPIRIRSPFNNEDDQVAELLLGEEQGQLLYYLGSDSDYLRRGREAMETLIEKHGKHPLAVYGRMVRGVNAGREFKTITRENKVRARQPDAAESIRDLSAVVAASEAGKGVDNISLNMVMRTLADVQEASGDEQEAAQTALSMVEVFRKQALKPHVMRMIEEQAAAYQPGDSYLDPATRRALSNHLDPSQIQEM
ncbi:MAG TPA: hypothetical protein VFZ18_11820 [Longimicrobiaceae bacterium]